MHEQGTSRPRRAKTKEPGVYLSRSGEYEIAYRDSEGKQVFRVVKGGFQAAKAARAEIVGKKHRNETIVAGRRTFTELADEWYAQLRVAERTRERYEANLRLHLKPRFGRRRAQDVTVDDVARLIAELDRDGKKGWTVRNVLVTLSSLYTWSVRKNRVGVNPVRGLVKGERPDVARGRQRIFEPDEIAALLAAATSTRYRVLLTTAIFTGLRLSELLALRWQDVDFGEGLLRVRHQLARSKRGQEPRLVPLKTRSGERDVVLATEFVQTLREFRVASLHSRDLDHVFAAATGRPMNWRNAETRGFDAAVKAATVKRDGKIVPLVRPGEPKPVLHDCRHTFASLLIAQGRDVVFVSRQIGHSDSATTLRVYSHLFDRKRHAEAMREAMSKEFGGLMVNAMSTSPGYSPLPEQAETVQVSRIRN